MSEKSFGPVGIIDIGSNSVRFVAYAGSQRVPASLFNEKVVASLGEGLDETGELKAENMALALDAIARFRILAREMGVRKLTTVATAAVRDATNGKEFLKKVRDLGLKAKLLPGPREAELGGLGVISAYPDASGIVADLGGGSLELIGVGRGGVGEGVSFPLGVLRLGEKPDAKAIAQRIKDDLDGNKLAQAAKDKGLYLVGGSFRALAQLDLHLADHPLPILHAHRLRPERFELLRATIAKKDELDLKGLAGLASNRIQALPAAMTMLEVLNDILGPSKILISAFGVREGLLYDELPASVRKEDPLLAAALEMGQKLGRFGDHGAELDRWISPLFDDDDEAGRIRRAACLLADIAWNAHPDFRSPRAVEMVAFGDYVGINARGRVRLARTLAAATGDDQAIDVSLLSLLREGEELQAMRWGRAIRLAQRMSAGTERLLHKCWLTKRKDAIVLTVSPKYRALVTPPVVKRLDQLALHFDLEGRVESGK